MLQLMYSLVHGIQPTHGKQDQGYNKGPEVNRFAKTQWIVRRGRLFGLTDADQQQNLVAAVGKGVNGFRHHSAGTCKDCCSQLCNGNGKIGAKCIENGFN